MENEASDICSADASAPSACGLSSEELETCQRFAKGAPTTIDEALADSHKLEAEKVMSGLLDKLRENPNWKTLHPREYAHEMDRYRQLIDEGTTERDRLNPVERAAVDRVAMQSEEQQDRCRRAAEVADAIERAGMDRPEIPADVTGGEIMALGGLAMLAGGRHKEFREGFERALRGLPQTKIGPVQAAFDRYLSAVNDDERFDRGHEAIRAALKIHRATSGLQRHANMKGA
jgi:hypothetical protein